MRFASKICIIAGVIINFFYLPMIFAIISSVVGVIMFISLCENNKSIPIGVFGLIFTSLLGGIFYLCWNPENKEY